MHRIALQNGWAAFVDAADAHLVAGRRWYVAHKYVRGQKGGVACVRSTDVPAVLLHRLVMGATVGQEVDHIDGNPLNNVRSNLRICSHAENLRNSARHIDNRSGVKGVYFDDSCSALRPWRSQIRSHGKKYDLGRFATKEAAGEAYAVAARELHGAFARVA